MMNNDFVKESLAAFDIYRNKADFREAFMTVSKSTDIKTWAIFVGMLLLAVWPFFSPFTVYLSPLACCPSSV